MQQAGFHHANALAMQIQLNIYDQLQARDSKVLAILQTIFLLALVSTESEESIINYTTNQVIRD